MIDQVTRTERKYQRGEDVTDTLTLYLREIARSPLLTAQQEVELAELVEAGVNAAEQLATPGLSPSTREQLQSVAAMGQRAKQRLIESNLRLVVKIAKRYRNMRLPLADLIQEGNLGLSTAVDRFDYRKGFRFTTYAHWWIRQSITQALAWHGRVVRLPFHVVEKLGGMRRAIQILEQRLGHEPQASEVAAELGVTEEWVQSLMGASQEPLSFDRPIDNDGETCLGDIILDEFGEQAIVEVESRLLREELEMLMKKLPRHHRVVLTLRFGWDDGRPCTLEEIAQQLGLSRERVRQIEAAALSKLRRPDLRERLRDHLHSSA